MRDILFRGKKESGEWVYGDLLHINDEYEIGVPGKGVSRVCGETVGQYTGMTDKNGNKIYEGDIVAFTFYSDLAEHARLEERPRHSAAPILSEMRRKVTRKVAF